MKFLKRRSAAIGAVFLVASGMVAISGLPAAADHPTVYLDRTIWLEDPPPPGSP